MACSISLKETLPLLSRMRYARLGHRFNLTHKQSMSTSNIADPCSPNSPYMTNCTGCGYHPNHEPELDGIYCWCNIDAERLIYYRNGGYHLTHLGDTMHGGRYRIMHKLGWGGGGTVWLARDAKLVYPLKSQCVLVSHRCLNLLIFTAF